MHCVNNQEKATTPPHRVGIALWQWMGEEKGPPRQLELIALEMRVLRSQLEAAHEMGGESCEPRKQAMGKCSEVRCSKVAVGSDF